MDQNQFEKLINYLVKQGIQAIRDNTAETEFEVDYVGIFAKDDTEFKALLNLAQNLGDKIDMGIAKTGSTFKLSKAIQTVAGPVEYIKIRKPDPTRPQRGAPDFRIKDYDNFKKKYLQKSGNFALIVRKDLEMIELKGIDVLVYFPHKTANERQDQ